ncbi:MAG TPA: hypothetical protein VFZ43_13060 [Anaerolineales bacterium]
MKKAVVLAATVVLVAGACVLPTIPNINTGSTPNTEPAVDVAETAEAVLQTAVAQTLMAQPTFTSAPPTVTATSVIASSPTPGITDSPIVTFTSSSDLTTTPATATSGPADTLATATLAAITPATLIPTLTIRLWGTLPPAVPSSDIRLINRSKTQAYISLQVTSNDGRYAVLEYPVAGTIDIKAPVGHYLYVAWVGGNKLVGNFRLHGNEALSITLYKDRVDIK